MNHRLIHTVLLGLSVAVAAAAGVPRPPVWAQWAGRARAALRDGLFDYAESRFRKAAEFAESIEAKAACAAGVMESLTGQGNPLQALAYFAAEVPPGLSSDAAIAVQRISAQLAAGDAAGALETIASGSDVAGPGREALWRIYAEALAAAGRPDEALAVYDAILKTFPGSAAAPSDRLAAAALMERTARPPEAIRALAEAAGAYPGTPEAAHASLRLARLQAREGDVRPAEAGARTVAEDPLATSEDRAHAWLMLAMILEGRGDEAGAREAVDRADAMVGRSTASARVAFARAGLLIRSGQLDSGRDALRKAIQEYPTDPEGAGLLMQLARGLFDSARFAEAMDAFQQVLDAYEDPAGEAEASLGKGWCLLKLNRPAEAIPVFDRAVETLRDPLLRAEAELKAADACFANGQYARAVERYAAFREDRPGDEASVLAAFFEAEALSRSGRDADAIRRLVEIETAAEGRPMALKAALRRIRILETQEEWDAALALVDRILDRHPDTEEAAAARLGRGLLRYRRVEFESALEDFNALVDVPGPAGDQAAYMRVWCLYLLGRDIDARDACRAIVETDAESAWAPAAMFWMGEYAFNSGEFAAAEDAFVRLAESHPDHALADRALYWGGRAAVADREFLRAIDRFNRLTADYPQSERLPYARFAQGDVLTELGQFDAALLSFEEVIRLAPDGPLALAAWGRKGDCHFTLGSASPSRMEQALRCYLFVAEHPRADSGLRLQAEYKAGRCLERVGRVEEALERYMDVVYAHTEERRAGRIGSPVWFSRAAFEAAAIELRSDRRREAVAIYRRVVEDGGGAAEDAAARMAELEAERGAES